MPAKKSSEQPASNGVPVRPPPPVSQNGTVHPAQSSSVPSTPHQHARKFSFESREPSPNATQNHSPRSAYSETNGNVPSLRPLPPRLGGCRFETAIPHSRRRMPYNLGTDRLEKGDLERISSKLSEENEKSLEAEMNGLFKVLLPTDAVETKRQKLVTKLEKLFNDEWPGHDIKVHLFGSSGNLLCSDDSDVDICITTPWKGLEHVCLIADLLDRHGMQDVVCISAAKVPIVKIWDPELKLACDMNVNNTLALENTRMVRTYVSIDERVRPLAMIIKYWTRRRIVNDAAFGGTLSSYTWICMIIAFLQLRDPPVLPALHQRHKEKLLKSDGTRSEFADDLSKLTGFGAKNKESLANLLFHFFRFYAYEFDYDKFALSIRVGKLLTKTEKKWHIGTNNTLCIEEPFNVIRNLGNTADDTSFRGLHLELRRAFDLLAKGKFAECWEQYVYPKEEERRWEKPSAPPRPVLLRSASQQQSRPQQRNNFNNRSQRNYQRNGNQGNRRGSNHQPYEQSLPFAQAGMPTTMNPQDLVWYQAQNPQIGVPQEILQTSLNALAAHDTNLRFQLFTHAQQINQAQALAHAQRMQGSSGSDRSRTNSFDNPPLTAPIRPELMYGYGFPMQPPAYFHPGFTTYPSSPASGTSAATTANGLPEFRRNVRETGVSSGGALRSQSQPASRGSMTVQQAMSAAAAYSASQAQNGVSSVPPRQVNGVPMSNYTPDELSETDYEDPKVLADSPEDDGTRYAGYYTNGHASPNRKVNGFPSATPAFNTLSQSSQGRRRLSTDQGPQAVLDRRMKRTSRSPSPLGHARTISAGMSAPLPSAPFSQTNGQLSAKPVVVNGSVPKMAQASSSNRSPLGIETTIAEDNQHSNSLYIQQGSSPSNSWNDQSGSYAASSAEPVSLTVPDRPVIVNGSTANRSPSSALNHGDASFHQRVAMAAVPTHLYYSPMGYDPNNILGLSRLNTRQLAPLDLATNEYSVAQDMPHLSPVYEHRTPSPTVLRKFEPPVVAQSPRVGNRDFRSGTQKTPPTGPSAKQHETSNRSPVLEHRANGTSRESGNPRLGKSPTDNFSNWQKSKPRKKGVSDLKHAANGVAHSEQLPKNEADRKGG